MHAVRGTIGYTPSLPTQADKRASRDRTFACQGAPYDAEAAREQERLAAAQRLQARPEARSACLTILGPVALAAHPASVTPYQLAQNILEALWRAGYLTTEEAAR